MKKGTKLRPWTAKEIIWLHQNSTCLTVAEICAHLSRSYCVVRSMLSENGFEYKRKIENAKKTKDKQWTLEELNWLCMHYSEKGMNDSAAYLGRTLDSVQRFCKKIGIRKGGTVWTQDDFDMFEMLYPHVDDNTISKIFRCPESAVSKRAALMGLTKDYDDTKGIRRAIKAVMDMTLDELFDALDKEERIIKLTQWINKNAYGNEKRT